MNVIFRWWDTSFGMFFFGHSSNKDHSSASSAWQPPPNEQLLDGEKTWLIPVVLVEVALYLKIPQKMEW